MNEKLTLLEVNFHTQNHQFDFIESESNIYPIAFNGFLENHSNHCVASLKYAINYDRIELIDIHGDVYAMANNFSFLPKV